MRPKKIQKKSSWPVYKDYWTKRGFGLTPSGAVCWEAPCREAGLGALRAAGAAVQGVVWRGHLIALSDTVSVSEPQRYLERLLVRSLGPTGKCESEV